MARTARRVVGHNVEAAGVVLHILPLQAVAGLRVGGGSFGLAALALAVYKQLGRSAIGVAKYRPAAWW